MPVILGAEKTKGQQAMNNRRNIQKTITEIIFLFLTGALLGWCY